MRSAESTAREARRARSARKLVGRNADSGGCKTGHPAFLDVKPSFELALTRIGTWGVTTGTGYRIRALTIAEKVSPPVQLWDEL